MAPMPASREPIPYPIIVPYPIIEAVGVLEDIPGKDLGYRPTIQWGGATVWSSPVLVPYEPFDSMGDQENLAASIADSHIVTTLTRLFDTGTS